MRVFLEIRVGEKRDLWGRGVEFQDVEFRSDFQPLAEFADGDAKQRGNGGIVPWVDQIHRARQSLTVGQRLDGLAVFSGGHGFKGKLRASRNL